MPRHHASLLALALFTLLGSAWGGTAPAPKKDVAQPPPKAGAPGKDLHGDRLPAGARVRLGTARWRLESGTRAIGFTPDGKGLVVNPNWGREGPLHVLEVPSGKELKPLLGATYVNYGGGNNHGEFCIATRGSLMAIGHGGRVDLWEMPAGRLLRQIKVNSPQFVLALAPDGKTVATGGGAYEQGKTTPIHLWDVATGRSLGTLDGHRTPIQALTFSADGKRLLSSSPEQRWGKPGGGIEVVPGSVRVWDVATRRQTAQYANDSYSVVFAPDGQAWAYQGRDNRLHLLEAASGKELAQMSLAGSGFVFTPDGKALATAGAGLAIRLLDAVTGKELRCLEGEVGSSYPTLFFAPDGKTLACLSQTNWARPGGTLRLWDMASGKEIRPYPSHQSEVTCIAHTPDGKTVASGSKDGSLILWEAATGKALHRLPDHAGGVAAVAVSRDGRLLASGGKDGAIRVWHVADGKEVRRFEGTGTVLALTFAPDCKSVWACGVKGKLEGWDVAGGKKLGQFDGAAPSLHTAAFSADGSRLAYVAGVPREFSGTSSVRVCRVSTGKELFTLNLQERSTLPERGGGFVALHCWAVAFSPDGRLLATSESIQTQGLRFILGNHAIRVWELATGKQILQLTGLAVPTKRLAFSPDGRLLAHGHGQMQGWGHGTEEAVLLRDISACEDLQQQVTGKGEVTDKLGATKFRQLRGHAGQVSSITFSPDRKTLLTGGDDGTVVAWDLAAVALRIVIAPGAGPQPARAKELPTLWERLANADAAIAYRAVVRLELAPEGTVPFLKGRLKPAPAADPKRVLQRIADLEARSFATRQKAFNELAIYAEQAEDALRKALPGQRSLEGQRRVQQLLDRLDNAGLPPEHLRALRAVALLERIGTPEARQVLEALARGAPVRLTHEAQAALERRFR